MLVACSQLGFLPRGSRKWRQIGQSVRCPEKKAQRLPGHAGLIIKYWQSLPSLITLRFILHVARIQRDTSATDEMRGCELRTFRRANCLAVRFVWGTPLADYGIYEI